MTISKHEITATVMGVEPPYVLSVIEANLGMDDGWSPYVQADLTCWAPPESVLELIDPRDNLRVSVTVTKVFGDWNTTGDFTDQSRTFDLLLRSREVNHNAGTMTVVLESDEALLLDFMRVDTVADLGARVHGGSLRAIVGYVLALFGATLEPGTDDYSFTAALAAEPELLDWRPGMTAWDFLEPLIQTAGLPLYCNENRQWILEAAGTRKPGQVNIAEGFNLTEGTDTIARSEQWFDSVVISYSWTDAAGDPQLAYDAAGTPGTKGHLIEYERPYPGAGAAQAVLDRALGKGRVLSLEGISDYMATPRMSLVATLPNSPIQSGIISSVQWTFPNSTMTIGSRGLTDTSESSWILAPEGLAWDDVPAGTAWTEYTP